MKKYFLIILILFAIAIPKHDALAATPTPTTATLQQQVDELKDRIASRVAELKLVEKRGIMGTVTDVSDTQITLTDLNGNIRIVDVDELTKFYSPSSKSFGISDVSKGMSLGALGLYNKQSRRILARKIDELPQGPRVIFGGVGEIDEDNFEITVVRENNQRTVVSIENITKTYSYIDGELEKSGFSKIGREAAVIVIGFPDKNDSNKIVSSRIILFPDVDIRSRIDLSLNVNPTVPPSTGSGNKLFPITR